MTALKGVTSPCRSSSARSRPRRTARTRRTSSIVTAGPEREEYDGLSPTKRGRSHLATKVNSASKLIKIEEVGASLPEAQRIPATGTYTLSAPPVSAGAVEASDFEGDVAERTGMGSFAAVDQITMVCIPDLMTLYNNGDDSPHARDVQGKIIAHCENMGDRMAILDTPPNLRAQDVLEWRMNVAGYDSKMAALYYPWIEVMDPLTSSPILIPAVGSRRRRMGRTDSTRGVHKAPANEVVRGANGLGFQVTQAEQGALNQNGINCIRAFPGRGIRIWGARTLSSDPEWRYINVRRLFNYVAESIIGGTQWSVFEPNDQRLWMQLQIAATNFLMRVWRVRRAVRSHAGSGVLRQMRRGDQPARGDRSRPGRLRDRHRPGQAGRIRDLPPQPVHRWWRRGRSRGMKSEIRVKRESKGRI